MGALEIKEGLVSDLLTVIADSELRGPSADLAHSLFEFLDVAHIHLGDLSMNVNNPARFIEVVVCLPKD